MSLFYLKKGSLKYRLGLARTPCDISKTEGICCDTVCETSCSATWGHSDTKHHGRPNSDKLKKAVADSELKNSGAFPKAGPIFQQPFSLPESAQTLAGIACRAAGNSAKNFPAASKLARTATASSSFLTNRQISNPKKP